MNEIQAGGWVGNDFHHGFRINEIGQVFGGNHSLVVKEVCGIGRVDVFLGRVQDVGQDQIVAGRGGKVIGEFSGNQGNGGIGQGGGNFLNFS